MDLLSKMFSRDNSNSKDIAKERLRLVLVHDRASISPQLMNILKVELIDVISKYIEIDQDDMEVSLSNDESSVALVASIPVRQIRRGAV